MRIILTFCALIIGLKGHPQEFNFNQLVEMTNNNKIFEIKMIGALNQAYKKKKTITYTYGTITGDIGASFNLPTNDNKYEPKYLFDDGQIYTQSEIEDKGIDENFNLRNKLRKEGKLVNKFEIDSFTFIRSKINSLMKCESSIVGFAENYNSEEETASTWYKLEYEFCKKILIESKFFSPNYKRLTVEFIRDTDFSNILKQIISVSKYIDIKEEFGSFISNYKYGIYSITSERRENGHGGIITIYIEQ
jgi:hypothetical protein